MSRSYKFIISGGGTGGHIFPALSIADGLKNRFPDCNILFVGAEGKMEMEKVPAAGYSITGLPVAGFHRGEIWRNLSFLPKLIRSLLKAKKVVKTFNPDIVIGVGGYASGPVLKQAANLGIPTVLQEQNSYAGVTNKILGKKAKKICVAYDKMDRFFPAEKIVYTGNPVRSGLLSTVNREEAVNYFGTIPGKRVILVLGGSLGARTINQSIAGGIEKIRNSDVQVIWQTGKYYYRDMKEILDTAKIPNIKIYEFINRMDLAFSLSDVVVSRAGAGTISELCLVGKPSILVPSPNVAEDHQTHNALSLVEKNAAILVRDVDSVNNLVDTALELVQNIGKCEVLSMNIKTLATPEATTDIVEVISTLLNEKND
jgi:UDP-N-acetylglucosamine--N-acetylmuramyl-(pentapeptide) pyrophosphoryl-undecaprenol N-acetylglucosamine transferase